MNKAISTVLIVIFLFSLSGCASTGQGAGSTGESAAMGAITGAIGGAILGALSDGSRGALKGAFIGAAVGGVAGFVVGQYRESQYKTADEVYKENPQYTSKQAKNEPPVVKNIQPYINDSRGYKVDTIKNADKVELSMKYDIVIPKYSDLKEVEVEECNTLVNVKGEEMDRSKLTRMKTRDTNGVDAGIEVEIPENLPDGIYTHVAIVKIGDQEYRESQQIQIARSNNEIMIYAGVGY